MKIYFTCLLVLLMMLIGQHLDLKDLNLSTAMADVGAAEPRMKIEPKIEPDKRLAVRQPVLRITNPPLNSVRAAHGNTDWHIDTANEFLFGKDMGGSTTAANHCPDTWSREHIHVGETGANKYYYDKDIIASGEDTNVDKGIDKTMLFFYAGHGCPTYFNALSSNAYMTNMRLGDYSADDRGMLRYYWQCSCEVFAHGPRDCGDSNPDSEYNCPERFDGSADSPDMRNVYERWGPVLDPCLRMACGVSTSAWCHEGNVNKIWDNYNNKGFDVADSFIDGLHGVEWVVPLCITKGGLSTNNTTLVQDDVFTNKCNEFSGPYYHIQFLSDFDTTAPQIKPIHIPEMIPIWKWEPEPPPEMWKKVQFVEREKVLYSKDEVKGRGSKFRYNKLTGALYARGERISIEKVKKLDEKVYFSRAKDIIKELNLDETLTLEPIGRRMMIASIPEAGIRDVKDIQTVQKNIIVTYKRKIDVDGTPIKVLGEGGAIRIQMNNDASLLNASKVWRKTKGEKTMVRTKKYEQAYDEALRILGDTTKNYELRDWDWGYKELSGDEVQDEMTVVFQFNFMPINKDLQMDFPPRIIEVDGIAK